ncbi:MAG: hypothetical protein AAF809_02955 [Bacteroidota bacterium]
MIQALRAEMEFISSINTNTIFSTIELLTNRLGSNPNHINSISRSIETLSLHARNISGLYLNTRVIKFDFYNSMIEDGYNIYLNRLNILLTKKYKNDLLIPDATIVFDSLITTTRNFILNNDSTISQNDKDIYNSGLDYLSESNFNRLSLDSLSGLYNSIIDRYKIFGNSKFSSSINSLERYLQYSTEILSRTNREQQMISDFEVQYGCNKDDSTNEVEPNFISFNNCIINEIFIMKELIASIVTRESRGERAKITRYQAPKAPMASTTLNVRETSPEQSPNDALLSLSNFLYQRTQEELVVAYVERFKTWLDGQSMLRDAFPTTYRLFSSSELQVFQVPRTSWRAAFLADVRHLPAASLRDGPMRRTLLDHLELGADSTVEAYLNLAAIGVDAAEQFMAGSAPLEVIRSVDSTSLVHALRPLNLCGETPIERINVTAQPSDKLDYQCRADEYIKASLGILRTVAFDLQIQGGLPSGETLPAQLPAYLFSPGQLDAIPLSQWQLYARLLAHAHLTKVFDRNEVDKFTDLARQSVLTVHRMMNEVATLNASSSKATMGSYLHVMLNSFSILFEGADKFLALRDRDETIEIIQDRLDNLKNDPTFYIKKLQYIMLELGQAKYSPHHNTLERQTRIDTLLAEAIRNVPSPQSPSETNGRPESNDISRTTGVKAERSESATSDPAAILERIRDDYHALVEEDMTRVRLQTAQDTWTGITDVYTALAQGAYVDALSHTLTTYRNLSENKIPDNLHRLALLASAVATSQSGEEMEAAFRAAALPVGGYRGKRLSEATTYTINSYPSVRVQLEALYSNTEPVGSARLTPGISLPIGLEIHHGSLALFLPVLDLGAGLSYRTGTRSLNSGPEESSVDAVPSLTLRQVLAPGAYVIIGFDTTPLVLGFGAQFYPELRSVKLAEGSSDAEELNALQFGAFLGVDLTLFRF